VIYTGFWTGVASAMLLLAAAVAVELISPKTRYSLASRAFGAMLCLTGTIIVSSIIPPLEYLWRRMRVPPLLHVHVGYAAAIATSILLMDFLAYWRHRLLHRLWWRFHALHHSATELHAANSYAHVFEAIPNLVIVLIPVSLIDFGGVEVPMAALMILGVLQFYIHSPVKIHFPRLRWFLVDNHFHRAHHSLEEQHFDKNFGIVFTLWDRLFGTAYFPAEDEWPGTGIAGIVPPSSLFDFLLFPLSNRFIRGGTGRRPQGR
jgi:sterol desaturase/sphingolipid hydroxylase (fatty acid hydroxylase superfamily)